MKTASPFILAMLFMLNIPSANAGRVELEAELSRINAKIAELTTRIQLLSNQLAQLKSAGDTGEADIANKNKVPEDNSDHLDQLMVALDSDESESHAPSEGGEPSFDGLEFANQFEGASLAPKEDNQGNTQGLSAADSGSNSVDMESEAQQSSHLNQEYENRILAAKNSKDQINEQQTLAALQGAEQSMQNQFDQNKRDVMAQQQEGADAIRQASDKIKKMQDDSMKAVNQMQEMQQNFNAEKAKIEQEKQDRIMSQLAQITPGSVVGTGAATGSGISGKWTGTWIMVWPDSCSGKVGQWTGSFSKTGNGNVIGTVNFGYGVTKISGKIASSGSFSLSNPSGSIRGSVDGLSISGVASDRDGSFCSGGASKANFMGDKK